MAARFLLRPLVLSTLLLACLASGAAGDSPRLRLVSDVWPPFTDVDTKPRRAVDLVHAALDRAGLKASTSVRDWSIVIKALQDGDFDGTVALWRTPARERFMRYSKPYMENRLVLVGRKGSDVTASSVSQLKGKKLAIVKGYGYGDAVDKARGPILVRGRSDEHNLRALLAGKVDYMLADELLIHYLFERHAQQARGLLQVGITTLVKRSLHFALRRDLPGSEAIIHAFNGQISKMMADGSYNRILHVGWIRTDVDGDGRQELVAAGTRAGRAAPTDSYQVIEPDGPPKGKSLAPQYVIDGKVYDSWDSVPGRYKVTPEKEEEKLPTSMVLLEFRF